MRGGPEGSGERGGSARPRLHGAPPGLSALPAEAARGRRQRPAAPRGWARAPAAGSAPGAAGGEVPVPVPVAAPRGCGAGGAGSGVAQRRRRDPQRSGERRGCVGCIAPASLCFVLLQGKGAESFQTPQPRKTSRERRHRPHAPPVHGAVNVTGTGRGGSGVASALRAASCFLGLCGFCRFLPKAGRGEKQPSDVALLSCTLGSWMQP